MHDACSATQGRAPRPGAVGLQRASCLQADRHPSTSGQLSAGWQRLAGVAPTALLSGCGASAFGVSPVGVLLRRQGFSVNHKRGCWLYREEGCPCEDASRSGWQESLAPAPRRPKARTSGGRWTFPADALANQRTDPCAGRTLRGELALALDISQGYPPRLGRSQKR